MMRASAGLGIVVTDFDDANLAVFGRATLVDIETERRVSVRPVHNQFLDSGVRLDYLIGPVLDGIQCLPR